jgi:hypothetical protein
MGMKKLLILFVNALREIATLNPHGGRFVEPPQNTNLIKNRRIKCI